MRTLSQEAEVEVKILVEISTEEELRNRTVQRGCTNGNPDKEVARGHPTVSGYF